MYENYCGRKFRFGVTDCYTMVRDFYKREFGIELRNYARYDKFWEDESLYAKFFRNEGFRLVDDGLEFGDLILVALGASVACHAAIYIGNGKILHHVQNRLSSIDRYDTIWKNWTVGVIRHKSNPGAASRPKVFDIMKGIANGNSSSAQKVLL